MRHPDRRPPSPKPARLLTAIGTVAALAIGRRPAAAQERNEFGFQGYVHPVYGDDSIGTLAQPGNPVSRDAWLTVTSVGTGAMRMQALAAHRDAMAPKPITGDPQPVPYEFKTSHGSASGLERGALPEVRMLFPRTSPASAGLAGGIAGFMRSRTDDFEVVSRAGLSIGQAPGGFPPAEAGAMSSIRSWLLGSGDRIQSRRMRK